MRFSEFELGRQLGHLALRGRGAAAQSFVQSHVAVALAFARRQAGAQLRDLLFERELAGLLEREQVGELRDADGQPLQRGVLAGHLLRQHELHDHEHAEQEHDAEDQGRQRVDKSGPVIDAFAAAAGMSHGCAPVR